MRKDIHPEYKTITVHCACGETFESGSTSDEIKVEICSKCHPFYTGQRKNLDKGGRIDKFKKKYNL
ncbi:50S ribosomal protein L31 [Peptostreptococcaceae bacterium AGR-M142]|jgi:large subunit ribosomal protein L31|nr:50S ribosomal protein L31 [Peptostreptococcaceae bacterium]